MTYYDEHAHDTAVMLSDLLDMLALPAADDVFFFSPQVRTPGLIQMLAQYGRIHRQSRRDDVIALGAYQTGLFYLLWQQYATAADHFRRAQFHWSLIDWSACLPLAEFALGCAQHLALNYEAAMAHYQRAEEKRAQVQRVVLRGQTPVPPAGLEFLADLKNRVFQAQEYLREEISNLWGSSRWMPGMPAPGAPEGRPFRPRQAPGQGDPAGRSPGREPPGREDVGRQGWDRPESARREPGRRPPASPPPRPPDRPEPPRWRPASQPPPTGPTWPDSGREDLTWQERGRPEVSRPETAQWRAVPGREDSAWQDQGREDPGREDSAWQDPGRQDPGREDSAWQDPGREDSGREDSGREDPGREDSAWREPGYRQSGRGDAGRPASSEPITEVEPQPVVGPTARRGPPPRSGEWPSDQATVADEPLIHPDLLPGSIPARPSGRGMPAGVTLPNIPYQPGLQWYRVLTSVEAFLPRVQVGDWVLVNTRPPPTRPYSPDDLLIIGSHINGDIRVQSPGRPSAGRPHFLVKFVRNTGTGHILFLPNAQRQLVEKDMDVVIGLVVGFWVQLQVM